MNSARGRRSSGNGSQSTEPPVDPETAIQLLSQLKDEAANPIALCPLGETADLRRLLELNRASDVASLALDSDGHVALLYEVPDVGPGLISRVHEQFGPLLVGLLAVEAGH